MGCCAASSKFQLEVPFERMEEYEKLKLEIEQFLSSKDPNAKSNKNLISKLLKKSSNQISKYENELSRLKLNQSKNEINDDLIESITQDIKVLKDYNTLLNNLMKENENIDGNNQSKEIINENEIIINNNEDEDDENVENLKNIKNINNKENSDVYFKKSIRRNKKGILNQKYNLNNMNNYESENNKNIEMIDTNDNLNLNNNIINIIFEFDNGEKVEIQVKKEEKFMDVINRLSEEKTDLKNLENIQVFDGKNNIKEKIIQGEKVENFNLNDFHVIQILFMKEIN
jgi:hypothetical protein